MKTIISLCDYTGNWAKPYAEAGYDVVLVDPKREDGMDVQTFATQASHYAGQVQGILMAPPCTHFAGSGAQYWRAKDADGRTAEGVEIIQACLDIKDIIQPQWWVLENPVGRLGKLFPDQLGKAKMYFNPCDYGDPYTKKTALWGDFSANLKQTPVEPVMYTTSTGKRGSVQWAKLGGKSERTKELRSTTPMGFAHAFFAANP